MLSKTARSPLVTLIALALVSTPLVVPPPSKRAIRIGLFYRVFL